MNRSRGSSKPGPTSWTETFKLPEGKAKRQPSRAGLGTLQIPKPTTFTYHRTAATSPARGGGEGVVLLEKAKQTSKHSIPLPYAVYERPDYSNHPRRVFFTPVTSAPSMKGGGVGKTSFFFVPSLKSALGSTFIATVLFCEPAC